MTLQIQCTRCSVDIQTRSGSSQACCEAKNSKARRIPEVMRQRKPAYIQLWCCPGPTKRMIAIAKNKPESVGRITLPSQLVRFTIPFSKAICRHLTSFAERAARARTWSREPAQQRSDAWPGGEWRN